MSNSEVKRLMTQLKDIKEERNKYRDALMARSDITPARLLTELHSAYSEGYTDGARNDDDMAEDWEKSWTFGTFLQEFSTDEMSVMTKRQIMELI